MQVGCGRCGHTLEFSHTPPRFCSNCGHALATASEKTQPYVPSTQTSPTYSVPEAVAVPEAVNRPPDTARGLRRALFRPP